MGITLNPEHLKRYKDIAWLLAKYGRSDLVKQVGLDGVDGEPPPAPAEGGPADPLAVEFADDLERLGPTFIKLGQLLSTRPDLLPPAYLESLTRLQDDVAPFPSAEAERIVETELGLRLSRAFAEFRPVPIAAASLGQVHFARLHDGRPVAVKVQRPDIRDRVLGDLDALDEIAAFLDGHTDVGKHYRFVRLLQEFRRTLLRELDYPLEAANLSAIKNNLREFDRIFVPAPIDDYTTARVLTMEHVSGRKITDVSPVATLDLDATELAEQIFRAYLKQILVDGYFHADPHPGNVLLTDDRRLALVDLGMVGRLTPHGQELLLQLILAITEGRSEQAAYFALRLGERTESFDEREFRRRVAEIVAQQQGATAGSIDVGRLMLEVTRVSSQCGVRVPPELAMLGKTLLNLDHVGRALDPTFDPNAAIQRESARIFQERMRRSLSPGNLLSGLLDVRDVLETLPRRVNRILDLLSENDLSIKVDAIDEALLIAGLQKIANRITVGLILAALILGASLLMNVQTDFRILGYPGLAMILFLIAACGGLLLMLNILLSDIRQGKR
ncbi:MAG TPA: AarF/UbiB family protein [Chloroflexota bacterium]|nr:AarF/UbiB family protein [Chloroflexota bacterium]